MGYGEAGVGRPGEAFPSFEFGRVPRVLSSLYIVALRRCRFRRI